MSAPPLDAARAWLAASDPDTGHAYRWWEHNPDGVAIMPCGRLFDVVEIYAPLTDRLLPHPSVTGPVIAFADTRKLYVLVPTGTADSWHDDSSQCLGDGHYLAVPDPSRLAPLGAYWVQAPDGSGQLTTAAGLRSAIDEAVLLLAAPVDGSRTGAKESL
ncbi:hypothetical protein ACGFZP_05035 [Kitasatospora sp. NPDC048239]|uniref:hypothetical protein n=1 Tax=Kitasatospora sp. NPDC048239 TaxID=3364046 RepID=UPI003721F213